MAAHVNASGSTFAFVEPEQKYSLAAGPWGRKLLAGPAKKKTSSPPPPKASPPPPKASPPPPSPPAPSPSPPPPALDLVRFPKGGWGGGGRREG